MMNKAGVFLDRDGTINIEKEYLSDPKQLELYSKSAKAIKELNDAGIPVVVVTNQSGIGRGMFTIETLNNIHLKLAKMLKKEAGAVIDCVYFCPNTPKDKCACRKPQLGMIEKAGKELNIDTEHSYFVGDKVCDIKMGRKAGGKSVLVLTGYGKVEKKDISCQPDYIAQDLMEAVKWILKDIKK